MSLIEELSCGGVPPTGPVSAWPRDRHEQLLGLSTPISEEEFKKQRATQVNAGIGTMASGLVKTGVQAIMHGKVSQKIRDERYDTCKACPFFVEESKRCSECGCFMEAKTWVGGDPKALCPKQKWSR